MKDFKHKINLFLLAYLLVFTPLLILLFLYPKEEIHIFVNQFHSPFLDELMKYWTYLGDGLLLMIIALFALLISIRKFFMILAAFLVSGIDTQIMKFLFFKEMMRPVKYFETMDIDYQLYLVPGVHMHLLHSFPSGHSAAAFSVFFTLALLLRSNGLRFLSFVLAFGVAFSRIYLSQHFLMDVLAGSLLGVLAAWVCWLWLNMYDASWLDKPLLKLRK